MTDGSRGLFVEGEARPAATVKTAEAPTGFRLRDLGFAKSLGQLTVSLFSTGTATTTRQAVKPGTAPLQGRLIFAMDATASREVAWDHACHIQAEMFDAVAEVGRLDIQLVHFRGLCGFSASPWYHDAEKLRERMIGVHCQSGQTQLRRVLAHALKETKNQRVNGVIYVGDAVEEAPEPLFKLAGELGMLGTPLFVFHEPGEEEALRPQVESTLREIARLSGGACCPFDIASAAQLRNLLRAVAVYAVGGRLALADLRPDKGRKTAAGDGRPDLLDLLYRQMNWRRSV
ncbi:MAG: VWA domain-containing protein [Rhodospirillaceae bacterium]